MDRLLWEKKAEQIRLSLIFSQMSKKPNWYKILINWPLNIQKNIWNISQVFQSTINLV